MNSTKKVATSVVVSLVAAGGLLVGAPTSAAADARGNMEVVSAWGSHQSVRARCMDKMRSYASMRVRITQECTYVGQTQPHLQYGYAFWWTTA